MSSCALLLLPRVALLALLELEGQPQTFFFRVLGLVGRRALAAPLAHRRRRLARVAVRARVPVRRQGRARRRLSFARGGRRERERPFRAVHGRVLCVVGVARHFVVRALAGNGSGTKLAAVQAVPSSDCFVAHVERRCLAASDTVELSTRGTCALQIPPVRRL